MSKFVAKVKKAGNSLVIEIPKTIAAEQRISENSYLEITIKKCQKSGFGSLKGMSSFDVEDELKSLE